MELKKVKAFDLSNEYEFIFINESKSTRNGFKHTTTLLIDNYKMISTSINYINRTWELYTFQSVMVKAIRLLKENVINSFNECYKQEKNITRLTKKVIESADYKNALDNFKVDNYYYLYNQVENELN